MFFSIGLHVARPMMDVNAKPQDEVPERIVAG
jgi:hypothetical protein